MHYYFNVIFKFRLVTLRNFVLNRTGCADTYDKFLLHLEIVPTVATLQETNPIGQRQRFHALHLHKAEQNPIYALLAFPQCPTRASTPDFIENELEAAAPRRLLRCSGHAALQEVCAVGHSES